MIVGLLLAAMLDRLFASLLFDVKPGDPATFAVVVAILALVAFTSSYIPALLATKVDPVIVLRVDG